MFGVNFHVLGQSERKDIEARRDVPAAPARASHRVLSRQLSMAPKIAPNQITTVQLDSAFGPSGIETITGSNYAVFTLLRAIEDGLKPQQVLPAFFGDAVVAAFGTLQNLDQLPPAEVMNDFFNSIPMGLSHLEGASNSGIFNQASLAAPLNTLQQLALDVGNPGAYGIACVTKEVDGTHTVQAHYTKSGVIMIGMAILYRESMWVPGTNMKSELWRAFILEAPIGTSPKNDLHINTARPDVPTTQDENIQAVGQQLPENSVPADNESSSKAEDDPTPTKRKLAPVLEDGHMIDENFNNYGNLTAKQILFGKDASGKFLVPSHHIFGGIYLKVFEAYPHATIWEAVNKKLVAEGFGTIQKKSCERRLSAAVAGRATAAAKLVGQVPDVLKALVDWDVSQGKDRAKSHKRRSQKMKNGKKSAYGTYGKPDTPAKQRKRSLDQSEGENDNTPVPPKKVLRRPRHFTPRTMTSIKALPGEHSGVGLAHAAIPGSALDDPFMAMPTDEQVSNQQNSFVDAEAFDMSFGIDYPLDFNASTHAQGNNTGELITGSPNNDFGSGVAEQEAYFPLTGAQETADHSWLFDFSGYAMPDEQNPSLDSNNIVVPNSTHWRGKPPV